MEKGPGSCGFHVVWIIGVSRSRRSTRTWIVPGTAGPVHDVEFPADVLGNSPERALGLADRWVELDGTGDPQTEAVAVEGADGLQVGGAQRGRVKLFGDGVFVRGGWSESVGNLWRRLRFGCGWLLGGGARKGSDHAIKTRKTGSESTKLGGKTHGSSNGLIGRSKVCPNVRTIVSFLGPFGASIVGAATADSNR